MGISILNNKAIFPLVTVDLYKIYEDEKVCFNVRFDDDCRCAFSAAGIS